MVSIPTSAGVGRLALSLNLALLVGGCSAQITGTVTTMDVHQIAAELGDLAGQLLSYEYKVVPPERTGPGQNKAIASARAWVGSVLSPAFRPPAGAAVLLHERGPNTCDAVQIRYETAGAGGVLKIQVSQTLFLMVIQVRPAPSAPSAKPDHQEMAVRLARVMFQHPERVNLKLENQRSGVSFSRQVIPEGTPAGQADWLDSLRSWADEQDLGFALVKTAGPNQAAVPSLDLAPNQAWFALYERPRTRSR